MQEEVDFLTHYGVKGMKWGVRTDGSISSTTVTSGRRGKAPIDVRVGQKPGKFVRTTGGKRQVAAEDAIRVAASRQLAKKSTTDSLTTKQLQEAVNRMNLEQQYATLLKKSDRRSRGQKIVQAILGSPQAKQAIKTQGPAVAERTKKVAQSLAHK